MSITRGLKNLTQALVFNMAGDEKDVDRPNTIPISRDGVVP